MVSARRFWSRVETEVRRHEVVEQAPVVRRGQSLMGTQRELVLLLAADLPLDRSERRVLAHRQPGAGLGVLRGRRHEMRRAHLGQRLQPTLQRLRSVGLEQDLAQSLVDRDRCVRGGVDTSGEADVDRPDGDLVGYGDGGLDTGVAGLLDVVRRGLRREPRPEDGLAGQVEVPAVLEDRTGHHLTEPDAGEVEPCDQPVDRGREHVLVAGRRVGTVGPGERDPVAAEDRHPAEGRVAGSQGRHRGSSQVVCWHCRARHSRRPDVDGRLHNQLR